MAAATRHIAMANRIILRRWHSPDGGGATHPVLLLLPSHGIWKCRCREVWHIVHRSSNCRLHRKRRGQGVQLCRRWQHHRLPVLPDGWLLLLREAQDSCDLRHRQRAQPRLRWPVAVSLLKVSEVKEGVPTTGWFQRFYPRHVGVS